MKVKALTNFGTATLSFIAGQVEDIKDEALAKELVRANLVEEIKSTSKSAEKVDDVPVETKKKAVKKHED